MRHSSLARAAIIACVAAVALASAIVSAAVQAVPAPSTIETIAGGGTLAPDGVSATEASLGGILGLAVDRHGDVFVSDIGRCSVEKISHGLITTVVGTGVCAPYSGTNDIGDGGPALEVSLYRPEGLAFDSHGNLFIADSFNCEIRKVDMQTGIITAFAGKGPWYCGGASGDGVLATDATLMNPNGIAIDEHDNVYFTEWMECRVRKVSNGIITTVAGRPAECGSPADGDGGPAADAQLMAPSAVAVDAEDVLYIAEGGRIREVREGIITTTAATVYYDNSNRSISVAEAGLDWIQGMAADRSGGVLIADSMHCRVLRLKDGVMTILAGEFQIEGFLGWRCGASGDGGLAVAAIIGEPTGVGADAAGNVFFAEIDQTGARPTTVRVVYGAVPAASPPVLAHVRSATPTSTGTVAPSPTPIPATATSTPPVALAEPPRAAPRASPVGDRAGAIVGPNTGTGAAVGEDRAALLTWLAGAMLLAGAGASALGTRRR